VEQICHCAALGTARAASVMRRREVPVVAWLLMLLATLRAGQANPPAQSTFRSGIDVIQVDVSVLDRDRRPVKGLTTDDFTVLEDARPRRVVSFTAVDIPRRAPPSTAWPATVTPDVTTNIHPSGRIVVIAIDDGALSTNGGVWGVQKTKAAARAAIGELGPDDLGAVVFTEHAKTAQNLTADRGRLLAAIENATLFPGSAATDQNDPDQHFRGSCVCGLCSIEALAHVAESLGSIGQQRKTILYISPGISVDASMREFVNLPAAFSTFQDTCGARQHDAMLALFRHAQLSNVSISAVDPNGIPGSDGKSYPDFLRTVAENTGGRAVVSDNDPERHVPALLLESSSYYLLGFEAGSGAADGSFHRIQVRVNRSDVQVRARAGYYVPTRKDRNAAAKAAAPGSLESAIAGQLPKSDLPLQVSVAPFADSNRKAVLAIVLNVTQSARSPASESVAGRSSATTTIEALASAFDSQGKSVGSRRLTLRLEMKSGTGRDRRFEILPRLPIAAGRYELRLSVRTGDGRSGSVYTYVDVPEFARAPLSLSGIVLGTSPTSAAAPKDAYADLLPIVPTARRGFEASERVTAFFRVYQGGTHPPAPATVTLRIVDTTDKEVATHVRQLSTEAFGANRAADCRLDLPISQFAAGRYLLTADVATGADTARRSVVFQMQ
jgi:VWFA-related protein